MMATFVLRPLLALVPVPQNDSQVVAPADKSRARLIEIQTVHTAPMSNQREVTFPSLDEMLASLDFHSVFVWRYDATSVSKHVLVGPE